MREQQPANPAWWDRLVEDLNNRTSASAVGPDRIRVAIDDPDGSRREVHIVMSPADWSELCGTIWGNFEDAAQQVRQALAECPTECDFLVYRTYELHPSRTETLAEDPEIKRMREHPEGLEGNWVAYGRDGKAYPFPEGPPRD